MVRTNFDKRVPCSELGIFDLQVNDTSPTETTAPWNEQKRYFMAFNFPNRSAGFCRPCL